MATESQAPAWWTTAGGKAQSAQDIADAMKFLSTNEKNTFGLEERAGFSWGEASNLIQAAKDIGMTAEEFVNTSGGLFGKQSFANYLQEFSPNNNKDWIEQLSGLGVAPTNTPPTQSGQAPTTGQTPAQNQPPVVTNPANPPATTPVNTGQPPAGVATPIPDAGLTRANLNTIAAGTVAVPGAGMQAVPVDLTGTTTQQNQVQQIASPTPVTAPQTGVAPVITGQEQVATTATAPTTVAPATMTSTDAGQIAPTQTAQGTLSTGAIATAPAGTISTTVEGATVDTTGTTVEAATATMSPEDLAQAASVAGLETARINEAKRQLRKAGLTDTDILAIGNDPDLLEQRLGDFTEEQLGMIGGLPTEALVSTQMEMLLVGLETGEVPTWARPAVSAVEQMLARRGLNASTVGRDALFNAVIQSAMPLAQQNAEAIRSSVQQKRDYMQQATLTEAQFRQQATLQNAQNTFNLKLTNLNNEQQARIANSQFMQTVKLTESSNRQQAAIQNAVNMTQMDLATVDQNTRLAIQNAQSFLQMDLTNLNNQQQGIIIDTQYEQQRILSNASAANAAKQFNAASENQVNMFMSELASNMAQFNTQQMNAMKQFNAAEANKISAQNAGNAIQVQQFNSQLLTQVDQFNSQQELAVQQWNAANAQAIEQSNIQWRRQANTANTAAQNAINQQNVQNAFSLTAQAQAALWQELRDAATFTFQGFQNQQDREAQLYAVALGNESAAARNYDQTTHLMNLAKQFFTGV